MPPKCEGPAIASNSVSQPATVTGTLSSGAVTDIVSNGDIILVVGQDKKRLHVSSHMMRAASETFDVLFGPKFSEGQNLHISHPKEIPLPDDDADAISILCRIVHLQNDSIPATLSPEKCLVLARLVDKYALCRTVYLAADRWLKHEVCESADSLAQMLLAAELMDHDRGFDRITYSLIFQTVSPFPVIFRDVYEEEPWMTYCKYILQSTSLYRKLTYACRRSTGACTTHSIRIRIT